MNTPLFELIQQALDYALQQPGQQDCFVAPDEVDFFRQKNLCPIPSQQKTAISPAILLKPVLGQNVLSKPKKEFPLKNEPIQVEPPKSKKAEAPIFQMNQEIGSILKKIAPKLPILEYPPTDQQALHLASGWKEWLPETDIVILLLSSDTAMIDLSKNLARAIQQEWGGVKIVNATRLEQEKRWDLFFSKNALRLIIASPGLERYPGLLKYYTAIPAQQTALLHQIPCLQLEDALTYQNTPEQKVILWKQLRRLLQK